MSKHESDPKQVEDVYDGIVELDNVLPPWWLILFVITILWSMIYVEGYHLFKAWNLQEEEYQAEMRLAELKTKETGTAGDQDSGGELVLPLDEASLAMGKEIYNKNCASCHAENGGGLIGPNLTDAYWIHGGDAESIVKVIEEGVIDKGMLAWKQMLKPAEILAVSGYIRSMEGTNPKNAKEPEGEEYKP